MTTIHPGAMVDVRVTRTQARAMAQAVWRLQNTATVRIPVKDQKMLGELRRRLYVAADTRCPCHPREEAET